MSTSPSGGSAATVSDRVWTLPNLLTALRLLLVPFFLWFLLRGDDGWALLILIVSGVSDYLDGVIARTHGLVTRLGQVLDPLADRLYILSTIGGLALRGIIPWWLVVALVARDVVGSLMVQRVRKAGYRALPVNAVGKAATFCLLYALPLLLLAHWQPGWAGVVWPLGWAFALWGVALYWLAAGIYLRQMRRLTGPAPTAGLA